MDRKFWKVQSVTRLFSDTYKYIMIIFFATYELSAYFKAENMEEALKNKRVDGMILGRPHFHFWDKNFIRAFENSDIDYLIWYTLFRVINLR